MLGGASLKKEGGEKEKFPWKSRRASVDQTNPGGVGNWPNLQHNPWVRWAAGSCPLPAWMSPGLGRSLVAWMCVGPAHQVLLAQVTLWKPQRGWNWGWHRWFLLGKQREILNSPKAAPLFPCPRPTAGISWGEADPTRGMLWFPHPGAVIFCHGSSKPQSQPRSSPLWVVLSVLGAGVSQERAGSPLGKHSRRHHQLGNESPVGLVS